MSRFSLCLTHLSSILVNSATIGASLLVTDFSPATNRSNATTLPSHAVTHPTQTTCRTVYCLNYRVGLKNVSRASIFYFSYSLICVSFTSRPQESDDGRRFVVTTTLSMRSHLRFATRFPFIRYSTVPRLCTAISLKIAPMNASHQYHNEPGSLPKLRIIILLRI